MLADAYRIGLGASSARAAQYLQHFLHVIVSDTQEQSSVAFARKPPVLAKRVALCPASMRAFNRALTSSLLTTATSSFTTHAFPTTYDMYTHSCHRFIFSSS